MKTIVITQRLIVDDNTKEQRDALDVRWADLFRELNYCPVLLSSGYPFIRYFNTLEIDGVILSGGNDLDILTKNDLSKKRDTLETEIIKYCLKNNVPLFGVCRGMQMIAHYFRAGFRRVDNHANVQHRIIASKDSRYYPQLKRITSVNSFHEWSVDTLASEFLVSVRSEDGVIEAFEHKKYKLWGQMWHPEREEFFNKHQLALLRLFFEG